MNILNIVILNQNIKLILIHNNKCINNLAGIKLWEVTNQH